ncbi:MAG: hypothetical protein LIP16_21025 [Clostridium sp.]|nr:hypothetical protein [Clostridium sp.]
MKTERYIITIFGIDTKYYTDEYVSHLWKDCANREYMRSNNYVTGLIDRKSLVCGEIRGCDLAEYAHVISTVRNPAEVENQDIFMDSLKNILREFRDALDQPSMTISIQNVEFNYFV